MYHSPISILEQRENVMVHINGSLPPLLLIARPSTYYSLIQLLNRHSQFQIIKCMGGSFFALQTPRCKNCRFFTHQDSRSKFPKFFEKYQILSIFPFVSRHIEILKSIKMHTVELNKKSFIFDAYKLIQRFASQERKSQ